MFPSITKINLNQSNKSLKKICDKLGINFQSALNDRPYFDVVFYADDMGINSVFAYIRKGSKEIEFMKSFINMLNDMSFLDEKKADEISKNSKIIDENLEFLLNLKKEDVLLDSAINENESLEELVSRNKKRIKKDKELSKVAEKEKQTENLKMDLDSILDKIDKNGIKSISKVEMAFLKDYSKKLK
jgi:hypothetical protein